MDKIVMALSRIIVLCAIKWHLDLLIFLKYNTICNITLFTVKNIKLVNPSIKNPLHSDFSKN